MLILYLVCLVGGGTLLGLSLLTGGEAEGLAPEVEGSDLDLGSGGEGLAAAARFLSVRNLVFFAAFFGLTGTLLTLLSRDASLTLAVATALGGLASAAVSRSMRYLEGSESGSPDRRRSIEGALAQVIVDVGRERPGKVSVASGDRTHQLVARIHEGAAAGSIGVGETALVVRIENGIAWIAEPTFIA
jgi:hypothetical protein